MNEDKSITNIKSSRRLLSLDILKTAGILFLFLLHLASALFLVGDGDIRSALFPEALTFINLITRHGAHALGMQIPFLAGVTFFFQTRARAMRWKDVGVRSLMLLALGFGLNLVAWGWEYMGSWDVLQFIAVAIMVTFALDRLLPRMAARAAVAGLMVAAFALSSWIPEMSSTNYLSIIIFGEASADHYWPLFPWYGLFAAGWFLGMIIREGSPRAFRMTMFAGVILWCGSVITGEYTAPVVPRMDYLWGAMVFKGSTLFTIGIAATALTLVPALEISFSRWPGFFKHIRRWPVWIFGQCILWNYVISLILGAWAVDIIQYSVGYDFSRGMLILTGLFFFIAAVCFAIDKVIARRHGVEYVTLEDFKR